MTPQVFRTKRIAAGITQTAVAKAINVSVVAVCRYEMNDGGLGPDRAAFAVKWMKRMAKAR